MPGLLLVDKPAGITSHGVVSKARKILGTRKIGHAGTLDPMATGLLVLGVDSATRLLSFVVGADKQYLATIRLGFATTTDDFEGEALGSANFESLRSLTPDQIDSQIELLTGEIDQVPSTVSAIKIEGKRAYNLVREGQSVELKSRSVSVHKFERLSPPVLTEQGLEFDAVIDCSSGTYVRALARDIGIGLGVGGHLAALRRTRVGPWQVSDAVSLDAQAAPALISMGDAASALMPHLILTEAQAVALRQGKVVVEPTALDGPLQAALTDSGELIAVVGVTAGQVRSAAVFPGGQSA